MPVTLNKNENSAFTNSESEVLPKTPIEKTDTTVKQQTEQSNNIKGLSAVEMNDPNSIRITVSDTQAPLVVLFGPPACGKTMTLVRLTRFLKGAGYSIAPIRTFRPTSDANYADICINFDSMINSNNAAESTNRISFMLVEVLKNGRRLCQILEAPGEYYFNPDEPNAPFPNYVNAIISNSNRKIWTIMVEPNWLDHEDRRNYVSKITRLRQNMRTRDDVIFVFNKIDMTPFVRNIGSVNISYAVKDVENLYPNIFIPFVNKNPISRIWRKYNCDFVPFQTGTYTQALNGITYQEGPQEYCVRLWNRLMTKIRG